MAAAAGTVRLGANGEREAAALAFRGVGKSFSAAGRRVRALEEASFEVRRGAVTGLIGPDGAGKTTVMRLAASLLAPDAGAIATLGLDTTADASKVQAAIGYMPQHFGLYDDLSVQENLDLYADLQGVAHDERDERYEILMHMTGLGPFTRRLAKRLSGGMKQKLGLACTLVRSPPLLLLDEPTVGVDPVSRRELWSIVYRLVEEESTSVFLSTAYLDEAERCNEVVLLYDGRVLSQGPPHELSAPLEGRTFQATLPGAKKRRVQRRLAGEPSVLDAVVHGDGVRVVLEEGAAPFDGGTPFGIERLTLREVPPRFEDGFVAHLRGSRHDDGPFEAARDAPVTADGDEPARADTPVIEVAGLQRRFGDFYAVKDVTFDVRAGEVFGLLGANGAGKSTTFRMLCGLLPPSAGSATVAGVDLRRAAAAARARIGYMAQKFSLYADLDVVENLRFFASVYGLGGRRRARRIDWALERFGLGTVRETPGAQLPLGYQQRLALACALMHEPEILFLDEPTSGVDPLARREFWTHIDELAEKGVTVMITTHFLEEAEQCDRLAIMAAGEILTIGEPIEIKQAARTAEQPEPSIEDAFIELIRTRETQS